MFLATTGHPRLLCWVFRDPARPDGGLGFAAAVNCPIEQRTDVVMASHWAHAHSPPGTISLMQTVTFVFIVGGIGLFLLYAFVNPPTMAHLRHLRRLRVIYTVLLCPTRPRTS